MKKIIVLVGLLFIFFGCSEDSDGSANVELEQVEMDESIGKPFIATGGHFHPERVEGIVISKDDKYAITYSGHMIKIWDIEKAKELKTIYENENYIKEVNIVSNFEILVSYIKSNKTTLWNIFSNKNIIVENKEFIKIKETELKEKICNKKIYKYTHDDEEKYELRVSSNCNFYIKNMPYDVGYGIYMYSNRTGKLVRQFDGGDAVNIDFFNNDEYAFITDMFADDPMSTSMKFYDVKKDKITNFDYYSINKIAYTKNLKFLVLASTSGEIKFFDIKNKKIMIDFKKKSTVSSISEILALSNQYLLVNRYNFVTIWNLNNIQKTKIIHTKLPICSIILNNKIATLNTEYEDYSPNGNEYTRKIVLLDVETKKIIKKIKLPKIKKYSEYAVESISRDSKYVVYNLNAQYTFVLKNIKTNKKIRTFYNNAKVSELFITPDNKRILSNGLNNNINSWNISNGKYRVIKTDMEFHDYIIKKFPKENMSLQSHIKYEITQNGIVKILDKKTNKHYLDLITFDDGEWVAITPEGYYDASKNGAKYLNVLTSSMKVTSLDSYYKKFYRPSIVKLALQGKTVDTGVKMSDIKPAPDVEIVGLPKITTKRQIEVTVKLEDMGGGIGDIRIYRNGVAVNFESKGLQQVQKGVVTKRYVIPLEKGKNKIEAIAFESTNAHSESSAIVTIVAKYSKHTKPTLHAVVIGIEEFRNKRLNLLYTKSDAKALKKSLEKYAKPLFERVDVTLLISKEETTKENISQVLTKMKSLNPNDMFLLFVSSHGLVEDDEYYLLTSNVGNLSKRKLQKTALSQSEITKFISNIPTGKKLIILDTCYSGALGDSMKVALLTKGMSEDTAIKILSRATGTTILSASLSTQQAIEGYRGHGLFSYVLLEGLKKEADLNGDGYVKTQELVNYIEDEVPKISEKAFGVEQFPTAVFDGRGFPVTRVGH